MVTARGSSEPAVVVEALSRRFGALVASDSVNLEIGTGACLGLVGEDGAGKTTLLRMLATLLPPSSGHARVAGHDVVRASREVRKTIGYVSPLNSADGGLTGRENLLLAARLHGIPRSERSARIGHVLNAMGLVHAADRLVKHYSGVMIRRLELAQATLHRPAVLFLDELTVGLDPDDGHAIWGPLGALCAEAGTTVILATPDMHEAERLCDQIAIMHRGRIVTVGTPAALNAQLWAGATLEDVFIQQTGGSVEPRRQLP
jgi:ABC-2 type transport system ATP-binding protein